LSIVPGKHALPWQHPKGHVEGLHGEVHAWFWQTSPNAEQLVHCPPPNPQALDDAPATQVLPWQQPNGQVAGLHGPLPTHVWPWQVSPSGAQFWHWVPPVPHADWLVPPVHVVPRQHPNGHDEGLHGLNVVQAWAWQVSPKMAQSWHCPPPTPHAVSTLPPTHRLPWQQPNGHVAGEQGPVPTHWLPWQVSPNCRQFWQVMPAKPHCGSMLPGTHVLPRQHPGHVLGLQVCPVWHCPNGPHVSPTARQLTHCWPLIPQAVDELPGRHVLPAQQPEHVAALQPVCWTHCWLTQASTGLPLWQFSHACPPAPHSVASVPEKQVLPMQQPLHVLKLQTGTTLPQPCWIGSHTLKPSAWQFWQASPPRPHWVSRPPVWQTPFVSQQPCGHVAKLHVTTSGIELSETSGEESTGESTAESAIESPDPSPGPPPSGSV
jgi:hypothetical protein